MVEHWTQRLKREKKELEAENAKLSEQLNSETKQKEDLEDRLNNLESELAIAGQHPPYTSEAARPDGLIVTLTDSGVNDIREANNAQQYNTDVHLAILDADELEIRVYSREDIKKYVPLTESRDIVGNIRPEPSWNKATRYTQEWLAEHNNLEGLRITVFDPYGFMKQFPELNIVKTHTEHEYWRTEEGLRELEDADIQRQIDETASQWEATPTFWKAIIPIGFTYLDGTPLDVLLAEAMGKGSPHPARLMKRVRDGFEVEYVDGDVSEYPICGFQFQGEHGELPKDININFACDRGQSIRVYFHGTLPNSIRKRFYERDLNDPSAFSPALDGGATIEFI